MHDTRLCGHHKETTKARLGKDGKDTSDLLHFLDDRNRFNITDVALRSISTGVTSPDLLNVDNAKKNKKSATR